MIRIHKDLSDVPAILEKRGKKETESLCKAYDAGKREFSFKSELYSAKSVKERLRKIQHDKCCFCESKISHISYGDVEHFRPKSGYRQNKSEKLTQPGYYWLAYEWSNLLFSCQLCNQRYKENLFPLQNQEKRAENHHQDISRENPLFIDPSSMNPEDYISFRKEIPYAIDDNEIGKQTIDELNLNRAALSQHRRELFDTFQTLYFVMNNQNITNELRENARNWILRHTEDEAEYAAMIRSAINRSKHVSICIDC